VLRPSNDKETTSLLEILQFLATFGAAIFAGAALSRA
jgi:hypothetical protein